MRRFIFAVAAIAGVLLQTGVAMATPVLHLSGWNASAGKPETFTITRVGGNGAATVAFHTTDGTAVTGPDYTGTALTISWAKGQSVAKVQVPTFINLAKAGLTIKFTASIVTNGVTSSATGTIVEPAASTPPPMSFDPETVASWVPSTATRPLAVGTYAFLTNGGPCCKGLIVKILGAGISGDVDPLLRTNVYAVQYAADPSGNYPATDTYWRSLVDYNYDVGLQGVVPGP